MSHVSPGKLEIPDLQPYLRTESQSEKPDPDSLEKLAVVVAKHLNKPPEPLIEKYRSHFDPQKTFRLIYNGTPKARLDRITLSQYAQLFDLKDLKAALEQVGIKTEPSFEKKGKALLHGVCFWGLNISFGFFLGQKVDPNVQDKLGNTPLHTVIQSPILTEWQKQFYVNALISVSEAKINKLNKNKETPLHLACAYGSQALICLLIQQGADVTIKDCNANIPINRISHLPKAQKVEILQNYFSLLEERKLLKKISPPPPPTNTQFTQILAAAVKEQLEIAKRTGTGG